MLNEVAACLTLSRGARRSHRGEKNIDREADAGDNWDASSTLGEYLASGSILGKNGRRAHEKKIPNPKPRGGKLG